MGVLKERGGGRCWAIGFLAVRATAGGSEDALVECGELRHPCQSSDLGIEIDAFCVDSDRYSLFPSLTLRSWSGSAGPLLSGIDRLGRGVDALNHIGVIVGCSAAGIELGDVEGRVGCSGDVKERSVV